MRRTAIQGFRITIVAAMALLGSGLVPAGKPLTLAAGRAASVPAALILLSVVVGVMIIAAALNLSGPLQWEAALVLALALMGIAVQCHDYQLHSGPAAGSRSSASP